jgi:hypothetical protein
VKRLISAMAALFVMGSAGHAVAAPVLEPPKPIETPTPMAPAGTSVAPVFIVDVLVSETGEVTSAKVALGDASLTAVVEAALLAWRFEPALRDGVRVAANIHLRVELRLPESPPPPPATRPTPPEPAGRVVTAPVAPTSEPPVDVTVRGSRPLAPHIELLAAEIREMPGAFGDAFRAIEALPGVTPILSGIPYFVIRGAPPGNTGFFLDDIKVPSLFHFAIGEAVIHPALVESVSLYSGAYPAHFGRFAGGILSGETIPEADKFHGEANVRLIDTGALLETPFAGGRGDALVSGRVGYPGLLLTVIDPNVGLAYYDYQARVSYRFKDGSEVRLFGFGSYDSISGRDGSGPLQQVLGLEFERLAARYTKPLGKTAELRVQATVGHDRTASGNSPPLVLSSESYSLLGEVIMHPTAALTVRTGADLVFEPYRFSFDNTTSTPGDPTGGGLLGAFLPTAQNDLTTGVYGELSARLSSRIDAEFGVRGDLSWAVRREPDHPIEAGPRGGSAPVRPIQDHSCRLVDLRAGDGSPAQQHSSADPRPLVLPARPRAPDGVPA